MRQWNQVEAGKKRRKHSGAGVILLAAALTACGGGQTEESTTMPSGVVQLEDIQQEMPDQEAASRSGLDAVWTGTENPVGSESGAGASGAGGDSADSSGGSGDSADSSGAGGDSAGSSGAGGDSADSSGGNGGSAGPSVRGNGSSEVPVQPLEEKLTPEGAGWGLSFGESGTQPGGNASPQELALYDAYFLNTGDEKVIYLTFDCGYENGNTEKILDALKAHNAPATFFVVGHYLETEPEIVRRMAEEGHTVGNHTYHHRDINTLDRESFQKELEDVESLFKEITGTELAPYYRPPEGKCGTTNLNLAKELGYATCFWSLAYVDWDTEKQPTHQEALDKLTARVHPGAIVLLHNTSDTNGEIMDELLTKWEEMGYTFAPLSELTQK